MRTDSSETDIEKLLKITRISRLGQVASHQQEEHTDIPTRRPPSV